MKNKKFESLIKNKQHIVISTTHKSNNFFSMRLLFIHSSHDGDMIKRYTISLTKKINSECVNFFIHDEHKDTIYVTEYHKDFEEKLYDILSSNKKCKKMNTFFSIKEMSSPEKLFLSNIPYATPLYFNVIISKNDTYYKNKTFNNLSQNYYKKYSINRNYSKSKKNKQKFNYRLLLQSVSYIDITYTTSIIKYIHAKRFERFDNCVKNNIINDMSINPLLHNLSVLKNKNKFNNIGDLLKFNINFCEEYLKLFEPFNAFSLHKKYVGLHNKKRGNNISYKIKQKYTKYSFIFYDYFIKLINTFKNINDKLLNDKD